MKSKLLKVVVAPFITDSWILNVLIKIPQIIAGALLAFHFGKSQFGMPWSPQHYNLALFEVAPRLLKTVSNFHEPFRSNAYAFALFSGLTKMFGGTCLILGIFTRIASFFIFILMTVLLINNNFIEFNFTFPLFFIAVSLFALYFGSSKFGVDYLMVR